ncbi:MAG: hypothetical protein ACFFD4_06745 [Candidatus Odinarchaeota archaeon]
MIVLVKIVILGDPKKDLLNKFFNRIFNENTAFALGLTCCVIDKVVEGTTIRFQVFSLDTRKILKSKKSDVHELYIHRALGGMVVFDACNPESYQEIPSWIDELWKNTAIGKIPIVITSVNGYERNKATAFITDEEAHLYAKKLREKHGISIDYIPVDERTGENIDLVLETLGKIILNSRIS